MTTVLNVGNASWKTKSGSLAHFSSSSPAWAIMDDETGLLLSKDGNMPSVWDRKSIAAYIAPYAAEFANHSFAVELI